MKKIDVQLDDKKDIALKLYINHSRNL